jgi:hypothetical protein
VSALKWDLKVRADHKEKVGTSDDFNPNPCSRPSALWDGKEVDDISWVTTGLDTIAINGLWQDQFH